METGSGPDGNTLKRLAGMLPSFVRGMAQRRSVGRGKPVKVHRPRKCCKVCLAPYDMILVPPEQNIQIESGLCGDCDNMLKSGFVALVCGDKYAFVTSPRLKDKAGEIMRISPNVMEQVEKEYGAKQRKPNEGELPGEA